MCSLLLGSLPVGMVGCKDYDDDITEINGQTSDLSKQLEALNSALQAAQAAATAAGNDAKSAASKADLATQEASLAKQAAEQAKAAAIEQARKEVQAMQQTLQGSITALDTKTAGELAALAGRIDGIESGLAEIDLTKVNDLIGQHADAIREANEQIIEIDLQVKTLENFKKSIGDVEELKGKVAKIDGILTDLGQVKKDAKKNADDIASNKTSISENKAEIKKINERLTGLAAEISTAVTNGVNTLAGRLKNRLTSITLIPELYVGGIPTIEFQSARYDRKVLKNNVWSKATTGQIEYVVSNNETKAQYRLNPASVADDAIDFDKLAYVTAIAQTTRATGIQPNSVVAVKSAEIKNGGVLEVKLAKGDTKSLNRGDNEIYTASLKVPVAAKYLMNGETSAEVYSEFTRLRETYFKPELRFVKDAGATGIDAQGHLWNDSSVLYSSGAKALVAVDLVYNKTHNLDDIVEGCKLFGTTHESMSKAKLNDYGFAIKYDKAIRPYYANTTEQTNQQMFAKVEGSVLTPTAASGATNNENIIGKEPIIRAILYDKNNNNVVEVGYFKVKFTAAEMNQKPIELTLEEGVGDPCGGATYNFTWDYMAKNVLEKLNDEDGMSKEEFERIYDTYTPSANAGTISVNINSTDVSTPVMSWTVTKSDLGNLQNGTSHTEAYTGTVTFKNSAGLYPDLVLKLKWTVKTTVDPVTLGTTNSIKWSGNTMKVTVVPMAIPYVKVDIDGNGTMAFPTAEYNTNILEGRNQPYVNGLTGCASYTVEYATSGQPQTYVGEDLTYLMGTSTTPVAMGWDFTKANQSTLKSINYVIANTTAGKDLVNGDANGNNKVVKVNWRSDVNVLSKNRFTVGTINLEIVKILSLQATNANSITDNSSVVTTDLEAGLRITDAYGNLVAKNNSPQYPHAADYWTFYDIKSTKFDPDGITIAKTADGKNGVTLASLNMSASIQSDGKTLEFKNNGSAIVEDAYLIVPVKVEHKWGTLKGNVAVLLKKKL